MSKVTNYFNKNLMNQELQKALEYFEDYISRSRMFLESNAVWDERTKNIVRNELKHYQVMVDFVKGGVT